jgi:hypothetical protein
MSKPSPARYRTTNWSSYNAALRKRGSLLIWLDKEMAWLAPHEGRPGRPPVFSDAAIQFCLSIKVLFKLPLRQTAGMVASLFRLAGLGWPVPDFSTLCRRQKTLAVQIPYRRADGSLNLLVDSTASSSLAMASGKPASMGHRAAANGVRCIWPWTRPRPTSAPSNSPPVATATVRCCRTYSVRSPRTSRSAP